MITLIEAKNFRCLHYIKQKLGPFHVLVGPNASGKTTFLDVVSFLGSLISDGLDAAISERTSNFHDLVWERSGSEFELAVEVAIPDNRQKLISDRFKEKGIDTVRYEIAIGLDENSEEIIIKNEKVLFKVSSAFDKKPNIFPLFELPPETIITKSSDKFSHTIINKVPGGNDNFYSEVYGASGKGWVPAFRLGPRKSALGNLPEDETKFPVTTWLKTLLTDGVQKFVLNSLDIRKASPPGQTRGIKSDGTNLPWVINTLQKENPEIFQEWIEHIKTALPDIENIHTIERADDKHRYLVLCYKGGLEIPSWMASDGTLRLLALTLPAYLPGFTGIYLIEEPENGIHPRAVEAMYQSLSSVYNAQILLASHSPVILSLVNAESVLCFAKTKEGSTDIVLGSEHPALREWQGESTLGDLFAGGVLG